MWSLFVHMELNERVESKQKIVERKEQDRSPVTNTARVVRCGNRSRVKVKSLITAQFDSPRMIS